MKSIYEASVAYGREHQGTVNIEDYQAGANHVLEELYGVFNNILKGVRNGEVTTINQVVNPILERMKELKAE